MKTAFKISAIVCALSLSGCSTVQNWFPDKEKDYQFTTELPPLVIPADLVQKPVSSVTRSAPPVTLAPPKIEKAEIAKKVLKNVKPIVNEEEPKKIVESIASTTPDVTTELSKHPIPDAAETRLDRNEIQISFTHENAPTLNLNVPTARAWRIVGKALSRSNIEVTNRNQETGQIQIQVADSKPQPQEEKSFLDETFSVLDGFVSNETPYVLQFHESNQKTAVTVLNSEFQAVADGSDNKLLMLLFETIKADLSK